MPRCALVCVLTLVAVPAARASVVPATAIAVRIYDSAGVDASVLAAALATAEGALWDASLAVAWTLCPARRARDRACGVPRGPGDYVVRLVRAPAAGDRHGPLGHALIDGAAGRGVLATIYVDRAARLAAAALVDVRDVLGRAIAHELGHLLLGTSTHSPHGLMRAIWSRDDMRRARADDWRFTRRDVAAIRARVRGVVLAGAPPPTGAGGGE